MKKLLSLCLISYTTLSGAMQTKQVIEGQVIVGEIAQKELSRVFVQSDRIKEIKSATSDFVLEKDEDNGQIFIMPHPDKKDNITLFLTTEYGKTILLSLKPASIPAQTLQLVTAPSREEKVLSYESTLFQLIQAMKTRSTLSGYTIAPVSKQHSVPDKGLTKKEIMKYQGRFLGKVVLFKNETDTVLTLSEEAFQEKGMKAIAIAKKSLMPSESTEAYLVYGA